jgi:hypothetical protein
VAAKKPSTRKRRKTGSHSDPVVAEAHGQIAQAQAGAETGVAAAVTRAVPDLEVEVAAETTVSYQDKCYGPGERLTLEGPDAINLIQSGHVVPASAK